VAETNFELSVKAEDPCAVEDQGVAKAKLQPRLLRLAMLFRGKGLIQRTGVRDTKTRVKSVLRCVTQAAVKAMTIRTHKTLFKAIAQGLEAVEVSAFLSVWC